MAKGTKELKRRITGVKNIQQITRAMEMVATQKLKRLQMRAEAARPFADKVQQMVGRLAGSVRSDLSPLLQSRETKVRRNLVISADKGLCGSYNSNLVRHVLADMSAEGSPGQRTQVFGSRGYRMLVGKGADIEGVYADHVEKLDFTRVRNVVRDLAKEFIDGQVDEVRVLYTAFESTVRQRPTAITLLPIRPETLLSEAEADERGLEFIVEPDADRLLQTLLPKFLEMKVYSAVLESLASEFTARRNAMKQATDAADDMIDALTRQYNRARQETITKELLEIVSGAEALA